MSVAQGQQQGRYSLIIFEPPTTADRYQARRAAAVAARAMARAPSPGRISTPGQDNNTSYFFSSTARTIMLVDDQAASSFWMGDLAPYMSGQYYVRYAAMSLTALHIHHLRNPSGPSSPGPVPSTPPRDSALVEAYRNQISATATFRSTVSGVTGSNLLPCLVFSISVIVFHLDSARRSAGLDFQRLLVEPFGALRSAAAIWVQMLPVMVGGIMDGALPAFIMSQVRSVQALNEKAGGGGGGPGRPDDPWLDEALASFEHLRQRIGRAPQQQQRGRPGARRAAARARDVCGEAGEALLQLYLHSGGAPKTWVHIIWWPAFMPEGVYALVAGREPRALLLVVYWCVVMARAARRWYWDGWAGRAAAAALAHVGPEWEDVLAWPRRELGLQGNAEVVVAGPAPPPTWRPVVAVG